jgi:acetyl-CoA acetyltransferase
VGQGRHDGRQRFAGARGVLSDRVHVQCAVQLTDGAAAVLLMRRSKANELGLTIIAKHIATATAGLPPRVMGIGPAFAIPKVLKRCGLTIDDCDLIEVNEAFASMVRTPLPTKHMAALPVLTCPQYVYCVEKLALPLEKTNVNGGAIAFGHPLGCTGARQVATGLSELHRRGGKVLLTSMWCVALPIPGRNRSEGSSQHRDWPGRCCRVHRRVSSEKSAVAEGGGVAKGPVRLDAPTSKHAICTLL